MKKLTLLPLLAGLLLALPGRAADESAAQNRLAPSLTFEFPGGTLTQLIAALAKMPGGALNVIGDPADMATPLPAFTLQNAIPDMLPTALGQFLESRGLHLVPVTMGGQPATRGVFVLRRFSTRNPMVPPDFFEPIQLAPYLEEQKVDDIVGAIRAAWEMNPANDPSALRIKYHAPTTILLVSGPPEATQLATKVVGSLKRSATSIYAGNPKPETGKPDSASPKAEKR